MEQAFSTNIEYLTRQQVADLTGFAVITLDIWRMKGRGPRFMKVGRCVRYTRADIDAWMAAHMCEGGAAKAG